MLVVLVLLLLLLPSAGWATLRGLDSIDWQTLHAEAIVLGKVSDVQPVAQPSCYMCSTVTVAVKEALKGPVQKQLDCTLKGWPSEYSHKWLANNHEMLFFLSKESTGWVIDNGLGGAIDLNDLSNALVVSKTGEGLFDKDKVIDKVKSVLATKRTGVPKSKSVIVELTLRDHGKQIILPRGNQASVTVPLE